jgi:hypothetical protein
MTEPRRPTAEEIARLVAEGKYSKRSRVPYIVGGVFVLILVSALLMWHVFFPYKPPPVVAPIQYPGVKWISVDSYYTEKKNRVLDVAVQFPEPVVAVPDVQTFMGELIDKTKDRYTYYRVKAVNSKGVVVLEGWSDNTGDNYKVSPTYNYSNQ